MSTRIIGSNKSPHVKVTAFGASNSLDDPGHNRSDCYVTQSYGKFKAPVQMYNASVSGIGAVNGFSTYFTPNAAPSFDATKLNILTMQFGETTRAT